jgi:hypothetical protein
MEYRLISAMNIRKKSIFRVEGGTTEIQMPHPLKTQETAGHEKKLGKELEPKLEPNNGNNLQRLASKSVSRPIVTLDVYQKVMNDRLSKVDGSRNSRDTSTAPSICVSINTSLTCQPRALSFGLLPIAGYSLLIAYFEI